LGEERLRVSPCALTEADFRDRYGPLLGASCWAEFSRKRLDPPRAEELNARLEGQWSSIRERLRGVVMPPERMASLLADAGAPRRPEELGWPPEFYRRAVREAREIRDRFTFLDLAADSGLLDDGLLN